MARRNHPKHGRRNVIKRYDLDYVSLPGCPNLRQVVIESAKTIYINLSADFSADCAIVARNFCDPVIRGVALRKGGKT